MPAAIGQAESLFVELMPLPPAERAARIAACRAIDPDLADEVAALLDCHDQAEDFLHSGELREKTEELDRELPPETRVGGYTILGHLGSGGMGVVYVAQQERPRRTVALKLIRRGFAGASLIRRFEHEAEVLGRLQHPGIAQIFEAGVAETGLGPQPYIAMELIRGLPLVASADNRKLDPLARMSLAAQVCDAVQHAHQRGFIHRDLKPANIMVDEQGQPKILDFGIARAADDDLHLHTLQTDAGQLVGTLAYMSPEQFSGSRADVDTRSDVYALGVILYELLTGRLPYDLKGLSIVEVATVVRDTEPPRIGAVNKALRGDPETIVHKALEKDKRRRYQSAAELAADIRRCLAGEPIEAKRDSSLYILRKQLNRYRGVAIFVAAFVLFLIVSSLVLLVQLQRNRALTLGEQIAKSDALRALEAAQTARGRADATAGKLQNELTAASIEQARLLGRIGSLQGAEDLLWAEFLRNPASAHAYWTLWEVYWRKPVAATFLAHTGSVHELAFLPGDEQFATVSRDGIVKVWDRRTSTLVRSFGRTESGSTSLAASPTAPHVAVGFADGMVGVWDAATGEQIRLFRAGPAHVRSVVFSPDGRLVLTGSTDGVVRLWAPESDAPAAELTGLERQIVRVVMSGDGAVAASSFTDARICLWPSLDHASEPIHLHGSLSPASSLAFSPDGSTLISGGSDRFIRFWDAATGEQTAAVNARNGTLKSLVYSADGSSIIASGFWSVDVWDAASRQRLRALPMHASVWSARLDRAGSSLISAAEDGVVRVWDLSPDAGVTRLRGHSGRVSAEISPDGALVVTGDEAGVLRFWDAGTGALLDERPLEPQRIRSLAFHPGGGMLASGSGARRLHLWDLRERTIVRTFDDYDDISAYSAVFSSDGERLAYARPNGSIVVRSVATGEELVNLPSFNWQVVSLRFAPDGRLVTVDRSYTIRIWGPSGERLAELRRPDVQPWTVAFAPDGRTLLAGSWARTVEIWDMQSQHLDAELRGHTALVARVEIRPGAPTIVASAGNDGALCVWDYVNRRQLAGFEPFGGWDVTSVSWSPDGRRLLTAGADGTAAIIDLAHFESRIAGNAAYQRSRLSVEDAESFPVGEVRDPSLADAADAPAPGAR